MALTSTIYRFQIQLSDVDREVYDCIDVRLARHPSETEDYLVTRVLAYALELIPDLAFGRGLSTPEDPGLFAPNDRGGMALWIEIGSPSSSKMHKVAKQADEVRIYTHKSVDLVLAALDHQGVHRAEEIELVAIPAELLDLLCPRLGRKNSWELLRTEDTLYLTVDDLTLEGRLTRHRLESNKSSRT